MPPGVLAAGDGAERISTGVAALVDTNILVYRFDGRFPEKRRTATEILTEDLQHDRLYGTVRVVNPFIDLL